MAPLLFTETTMRLKALLKTAHSKIFGTEDKLLDRSRVFCMAPWVQLHAQTNGKVAPCCMSTVMDGNEIGDLRENPDLSAAWNSENMKQLRRDMLNNRKNSLCTNCYRYEDLGKESERQHYNRDFKRYFSRVNTTNPDGSIDEMNVPVIDIRFSNKCNYKCRICSSEYSSLWFEEEQKAAMSTTNQSKEVRAANDPVAFWESYKKMLPHVEWIHFAGGEPLFMDEHYATLEELIAVGNKDVVLSYNTNFSTLRYKKNNVAELWNRFKKVDVWASLDGMFEKGDYQRKGQKWEKIEENIRTIQQQCPNVLFGVNVTVSIFNVLDIPAFYRYMVDNKLVRPERMNLYLLFEPAHFRITNLTPALKNKVVQQFREFEESYLNTVTNNANIKNHIKAVIAFMMGDESAEVGRFKSVINAVDAIRDEHFVSTFPELAELTEAKR